MGPRFVAGVAGDSSDDIDCTYHKAFAKARSKCKFADLNAGVTEY